MTVDLDALDDLTEFTNYWIDLPAGASERETLRQTLHEIHAHFHVAPAEPVTLTAEERETRMMSKLPSIAEMADWLDAHGFRLVRTGGD